MPDPTPDLFYPAPVILVEENWQRWLVAPYGEVGWVQNARAAGRIILRSGRQPEIVIIAELRSEEAALVLKKYISQYPITRPFYDVTPQSAVEDFIAEAPRHPVFAIEHSLR